MDDSPDGDEMKEKRMMLAEAVSELVDPIGIDAGISNAEEEGAAATADMDSADVIGTSLTRTKDYSHWLAFRALHAEFWEMLIRASN
jgi:hypothetical protein